MIGWSSSSCPKHRLPTLETSMRLLQNSDLPKICPPPCLHSPSQLMHENPQENSGNQRERRGSFAGHTDDAQPEPFGAGLLCIPRLSEQPHLGGGSSCPPVPGKPRRAPPPGLPLSLSLQGLSKEQTRPVVQDPGCSQSSC